MKRLLPPAALAAVLTAVLAAGCGQLAEPAPYGPCGEPVSRVPASRTSGAPDTKAGALPADEKRPSFCIVAAPLFRPDFRAGVRLNENHRVKITFSKEAVADGAPDQSLELGASIIVKGDSISATFTTLNRPFWRISATPSTTAESRHPLLTSRLRAKGLIRDLTFMYWPVESLEASLAAACPDCRLHASGSVRTLARNGQRVLESRRTGNAVILRNYPEGYELEIAAEDAR